jgi:hypothetical protein
MNVFTVQETINRADLVAIVKRIDNYGEAKADEGPGSIRVEVIEVLKGDEIRKELELDSYYGMCIYGFYISPGETALIAAQKYNNKTSNPLRNVDYTRIVDYNLFSEGFTVIDVVDNKVDFYEGRKNINISIQEFKKLYFGK